jgi:hypothetical protein
MQIACSVCPLPFLARWLGDGDVVMLLAPWL